MKSWRPALSAATLSLLWCSAGPRARADNTVQVSAGPTQRLIREILVRSNGLLEWNLGDLERALQLTEDEVRTYFTDGRRISFILERRA